MKPDQLEDLLRYRMEEAHETLREASVLLGASAEEYLHAQGHLKDE